MYAVYCSWREKQFRDQMLSYESSLDDSFVFDVLVDRLN